MARMWVHFVVFLVLSRTASSLQCPDGQKCEGSSTCCKLSEGDKYTCCDQPQFTGASLRMLPPESRNEISSVVCPDASTCPVTHSCQLSLNSTFACCPWKEAISCTDGHRCCPLSTHCSTDGRVCIENEGIWRQDSISAVVVRAVQCPDSEWECPDGCTCCLMADESWGCCPMPEASCCADKIHCCPHGTTCDLVETQCLGTFGEQPLSKKFPAKKRTPVLNLTEKNICPGNHSSCPDAATCCLLPTGEYGCCPLQNAVCCSDHLHCCPQGTQCDLKHSICTIMPEGLWPITHLTAGLQTAHDIQCDAKFTCPDGNTCCKTTSGSWGCCPLEEAICCPDHTHCCPKGYQCNLSEGTCLKDGQSIPLVPKIDTSSTTVSQIDTCSTASSVGRMVQCGPYTACHDGQTCCRLTTGAWGCCLLTQATCCQDQIHCCPSGYTYNSSGTCLKDGDRIPWVEKTTAIVDNFPSSRDVKCDDRFSCADGQTCCMRLGAWACCPLFQAVCCKDQAHCCPHGYTCDIKHSFCIKSGGPSQGILVTPILARQESVVKCDNFSSCKDKETCCKMASGNWGCCPFPKAVCCEDHQHCCPSGYTCNVTAQSCEKQHWPGLVDAAGGLPTSPHTAISSQDVLCGEQHYCHVGQTCCKARSGGWACCPYEKGTCCHDRRHCCPSGFRCSLFGFHCYKKKPLRWDTGTISPHSIKAHVLL
ncbi:progranulin isoform X1 [Ahaetulla prasina]|uniref:progranulin isoform X1 n=1 Tax=Ahaetulla prasina TaxID=499056 RepID=UPI002649E51A|nr:progranulin isoform X1 [Ahaetulla prasina]